MRLSEVKNLVNGKLLGNDLELSSISINTKTLVKGDLYIAIKGRNFDGHAFIDEAIAAGTIAVLVARKIKTKIPQIIVKDTRIALAKLAGAWKLKHNIKTIAVTGSNGKTTVKEMIVAILGIKAKILFTQGNLNNDIGVALTLMKLQDAHKYAVIEIGANHVGEIAYSSNYVQPDIAVITNAKEAHLTGFCNLAGIAKAKGEIIQSLGKNGIAVLNRDDEFYSFWLNLVANRQVVSFGLNAASDIKAEDIVFFRPDNKFLTQFKLVVAGNKISLKLCLAGKHNVINALAATASCLCMGIGLAQIQQGLENLHTVTGRLQFLTGKLGNIIIDDTYNANPDSFQAALKVLTQIQGQSWVVLGALGEMGVDSLKIHKELGKLIKSMGVVRLLAIGSDAKAGVKSFGKGGTFFNTQAELITILKQELKGNETLLIKGSRTQKMENIVSELI